MTYQNNNTYNAHATPPNPNRPQKNIIGAWYGTDYGKEWGKELEFEIYETPTKKGGMFKSFQFFRQYMKADGSVGRGFDFPFSSKGIKDLVEKINILIQMYAPEKGVFVFQPFAAQANTAPLPAFGTNVVNNPPQQNFNRGGYPNNPPPQNNFAPNTPPAQNFGNAPSGGGNQGLKGW